MPFSGIYGLAVFLRNKFFDWKLLKSVSFPLPVISIGNLRVGGTGKTPHVEYLIRFLMNDFQLATLSRGYRRKTKGFILAGNNPTAEQIGDEPAQIKRKFPSVKVAVDTKRVRGISKILEEKEITDVVILDDAFQHRYVKPGLSMLLFNYSNLLKKDFLLPAGRLREPLSSINRADIIIVTKIPQTIPDEEIKSLSRYLKHLPSQDIYFTGVKSKEPIPVFNLPVNSPFPKINPDETDVLLLTGIANPQNVRIFAEKYSNSIFHMAFPDHHSFTIQDIRKIMLKFEALNARSKIILSTEKDAMRLHKFEKEFHEIKHLIFYIPIEVYFHGNSHNKFNQRILNYVKSYK